MKRNGKEWNTFLYPSLPTDGHPKVGGRQTDWHHGLGKGQQNPIKTGGHRIIWPCSRGKKGAEGRLADWLGLILLPSTRLSLAFLVRFSHFPHFHPSDCQPPPAHGIHWGPAVACQWRQMVMTKWTTATATFGVPRQSLRMRLHANSRADRPSGCGECGRLGTQPWLAFWGGIGQNGRKWRVR